LNEPYFGQVDVRPSIHLAFESLEAVNLLYVQSCKAASGLAGLNAQAAIPIRRDRTSPLALWALTTGRLDKY